ncbi:MAG: terminase large subunit [Candidatus Izemoplasmatales bacterium]
MSKIILDEWQEEALAHEGNLLLCTGRQVGKTFIMSRKAAEYLIKHPKSKIIVCSLTEDQAQLMIVMTLSYLEQNYKSMLKKPYSKNITKNKIVLSNGSQIIARPVGNTGDAVRGFTGDVLILDEASRFNEFIFTASKPTLLTTGGQIWMCSTPFGKQGYFYECYLNKSGRFKVIHTNSWDVVNTRQISEVWTEKKRAEAIRFLEDEKNDMSELQFAQEYLGLFQDDLQQFFPDNLIKKCCVLKRQQFIQERDYYMGVDIARMGTDRGSFEILCRINKDRIEQVGNETSHKKLTTETFDRIIQLDRQYKFNQIGIDAGSGSLGVGVLDFLLREPSIRKKVIALNNRSRELDRDGKKKTTLLKEDMYLIMRWLMERGVLFLLDDDEVMQDLKNVQYEYITTAGKKVTMRIFANPSADIVEGITRACYLANQKSLNLSISYI